MNSSLKNQINKFFYLFLLIFILIYAPMSMEYFFKYFYHDSPRLWDHFFAWFVGNQQALGSGSADVEQLRPYMKSRVPMLFHTIFGGIAILIAIHQFYHPLRIRYPKIHKLLGRLQVLVVTITVVGSMIYLINTSTVDTFSGTAFHYLLWLLAIGTLLSLYLAVWAVIKKEIRIHLVFMIFNFGALLSAPVLRLEWLIIGQIPNITQETSNLFSALIFAYLLTPVAIIATRLTDTRTQLSHTPSNTHKTYSHFLAFILMMSVFLYGFIAILYYKLFSQYDPFFYTIIFLFILTFVWYWTMLVICKRKNLWIAYREWYIHMIAFAILPILFLIIWFNFSYFYSLDIAFQVAAMTTPPTIFGIGYGYMAWTRRSQYQL